MARSFFQFRFLRFLLPVVLALFFLSLIRVGERRLPWYERALWNLVAPVQYLFRATGGSITGVWHHYIALVGVEKENQKLSRELAETSKKIFDLAEVRQENERLHGLLLMRGVINVESVSARVLANDPLAEFQSIVIDRGHAEGIDILMPVVGPRGLIGRIGKVAAHKATVLLLNDPNSTVDVFIQRSRARALLVGVLSRIELRPGHYVSRLEYLHRTSDIQEGDVVVTSGFDDIFPSGIPLGTIVNLTPSALGVFREAEVIPFENFSEVEEVLVLKTKGK